MGQILIQRGAGEDVGHGHITILPHAFDSITQGDWTFVVSASQVLNGWFANSGGSPPQADLDQINYKVFLAKGTYTVSILTLTFSTGAFLELIVDGVSQGTTDLYTASTIFNIKRNFSGIVITTSGLVDINLKVNGRNASATDWFVALSSLSLFRTA